MARIAVIGGSGYAGSHIVAEAVNRGHTRRSRSRARPPNERRGRHVHRGHPRSTPPASSPSSRASTPSWSAVAPPRRHAAGNVRDARRRARVRPLPESVRVGVIGGAGGSLVAAGRAARLVDLPSFPEEYKPEALEAIGHPRRTCRRRPRSRDWFYIHPAGGLRRLEPGRAHRLVPRRRRGPRDRRRGRLVHLRRRPRGRRRR